MNRLFFAQEGCCVRKYFNNIVGDVIEEAGGDHETFSECTETEREKVRKTLQPFMN